MFQLTNFDTVDGGMGYNNPMEQALDESKRIWKSNSSPFIVSIGSEYNDSASWKFNELHCYTAGRVDNVSVASQFSLFGLRYKFKLAKALATLATNAQNVHNRVSGRVELKGSYFRFNVDRGLSDIPMDKYEQLGPINAATESYLDEYDIRQRLRDCANMLVAKRWAQDSQKFGACLVPAIQFLAGSNSDTDHPSMAYWYRETIHIPTGYPVEVAVKTSSVIRPIGDVIVSCRRSVYIDRRLIGIEIPPGSYHIIWIMWFFDHADQNALPTTRARRFIPESTHLTPEDIHDFDKTISFVDLDLTAGLPRDPATFLSKDFTTELDGDGPRHVDICSWLLRDYARHRVTQPQQEGNRGKGWVEIRCEDVIVVDTPGIVGFVISRVWDKKYRFWQGGWSFGGVRLEPVSR